MEKKSERKKGKGLLELQLVTVSLCFVGFLMLFTSFAMAVPTGPSGFTYGANETGAPTAGLPVNVSGGYIAHFNITATSQNPHWKAFVGHMDGRFTLDDASGDTIYDWSLTSVSGEVYATRNGTTPTWSSIGCASAANINAEDTYLQHTGEDNITSTFNKTNTNTFTVSGTPITSGLCSATNTYVSDSYQTSTFEQILLYDTYNVIFTTVLEQDATGFDGGTYDFQMLVPENGSSLWSGVTLYYLYVELS